MNKAEQILLQAIQKSLWNRNITFSPDIDWDAALQEAADQAVLGIVIGFAPTEIQKEWKGRASAEMAHFIRILHSQGQLYMLLRDNGIPVVILKGTAAAIYYPNPSQRSMGDIDFLVPSEHFEQAKELLEQNGYTIKDDPRVPRHIHVDKEGIIYELHRFFSYEGIDLERFVNDGFRNIEYRSICGIDFPMLPKLANGLVLLGHVAQHLKSGVGLRQVIDWMMYVSCELNDSFWNDSFCIAAREVGVDTVAIVITRMCQVYLGLSEEIQWCKEGDIDLCSELMDSLLSSGNFDRKRGRGAAVETVRSMIAREGLFRHLQTVGEYNWKAYHKHKWLKPLAWIYQIGRYAKQGFHAKRGTHLREDLARGKRRSNMINQLKIGKQ